MGLFPESGNADSEHYCRTKNEWLKRLGQLVEYWKARLADDMNQFKSVRQENLKSLDIDEEAESLLVGSSGEMLVM